MKEGGEIEESKKEQVGESKMGKMSAAFYLYKHLQHTVQDLKPYKHSYKNPKQPHSLLSKLLMAHGEKLDPFQSLHISQMTLKLCHFECIVFTITICITLRLVPQLIFINNRK